MKEFKTELEARERCCMINNSQSTVKKNGASRNKGKLPYTSSTLFAGKDRPCIPTCVYCNQQHSALKCNVVTKPDARRAILRRKGKCFSCLESGHLQSSTKLSHTDRQLKFSCAYLYTSYTLYS